ncbi:hypothetical protein AVEN_263877-1 [Araneus ventricosus]|uniref:Uncharacterized protein n=1 Tax=Araneus ventricosus TaxID=182803 RepID=A0A4Y2LB37_ARAVE|nr:hypothetical protein AVEN_263877-1 [Araneus ventricosus]
MKNASLTGSLFKLNGRSVGIRGIRGIKTVSPFPFPVKVVASITFDNVFFTQSLVPLHSFDGSRFRNNIIRHPVLTVRRYGGNPAGSREFRNSGT